MMLEALVGGLIGVIIMASVDLFIQADKRNRDAKANQERKIRATRSAVERIQSEQILVLKGLGPQATFSVGEDQAKSARAGQARQLSKIIEESFQGV